MRRIVFSLALVGCGAAVAQEVEVSVRPAGVTLIWEAGKEEAFEHLMVLNSQDPVALALYLSAKDKKIVGITSDDCKLTGFGDDQGTKIEGELGHFPRIAKDGSAAFLEVRGKNAVSPKAEALLAKGELKISVASRSERKRSKVVEARKGTEVELAKDLAFEISKVGKPDWGDDPFAVTLKIKRDIPEVAEVRFFDAEGKRIEAKRSGYSRSGFLGKVTVTRDYNLKREAAKLSVEVDRWTDLEQVMVPFDVKVGIGGEK